MDLVDFIRVSGESENTKDLVKGFMNFLCSFGINRFVMVDLLSVDTSVAGKKIEVLASSTEPEAGNLIRSRGRSYTHANIDAFRTGVPVFWENVCFEDDGRVCFSVCRHPGEPDVCKGIGITINQTPGRMFGMAFVGHEDGVSCDRYTLSLIRTASYQFCIVYSYLNACSQPGNNIRITGREREVLLLIAGGKSKSEAADILSISESAVKRHCENLFFKLDVNNLPSAVAKAMTMGFI